jgi:hypothetical protein
MPSDLGEIGLGNLILAPMPFPMRPPGPLRDPERGGVFRRSEAMFAAVPQGVFDRPLVAGRLPVLTGGNRRTLSARRALPDEGGVGDIEGR